MADLCAALREGAGAVLLIEEALSGASSVGMLLDAVAAQPAWSDCPIQVFAADAGRPSPPLAELARRGAGWSIVLLDRPVRPASLVSLIGAALRNRARQYALRDLLGRYEEARAEADAANRAKADFLAVMSHELRTPLNAIGGYAELLEMGIRGPVTDAQRKDLGRIQLSQKHLLGLVNEVLSYAKLETGTVQYDLQNVPVREPMLSAEALVVPQARAKGLELVVSACEPELAVRADEEKLRQILVNLLTNAVKFTPPAGRISMGCQPDHTVCRFQVTDTGIGIPADELESVFQPFVQVRSDLTRTQEGTGLGLAISRELARGMGGDLTAESTPGVGSTFELVLPRA
ncbi:MAG TPA: HAMP domain-containing sensor histidine kinase [Longimicrobium sp.]|nr:HAMP domain-containing sensor histidine kinase [Longimicrobium sp.]